MQMQTTKISKQKRRELCEDTGTAVIVQNGDLNTALRLFKQKVKASNKLREVYNRKEYIKPSVKRRQELDKAAYRLKKSRLNPDG
jgi:ribosomal protein S21